MGDHEVILNDLRDKKGFFESKAGVYGEDLGAPYRDAAESLGEVIDAYEASLPDKSEREARSVELVHCGGCERHSLLADAKDAAEWEGVGPVEPHCPRCGTRIDYEDTDVQTFERRNSDD